MSGQRELNQAAKRLGTLLRDAEWKIVFAESCTGGLVSSALVRIPGISSYHCGSAVVYRIDTKARWLGIDRDLLDDPGPVSAEVAAAMAEGVLKETPEADLAASITGHLGPDAPKRQDGLIVVGIARRVKSAIKSITIRHRLAPPPETMSTSQKRIRRQQAAAVFVLNAAADAVEK